ncbi:carbohydrate-responsive element-binding protein [Brachionichthys hirsutus]|uniref:carbohydrate-responsive element-binding protein n=1 Tax=Brachionichthys hirsutus TaxID=412623 RepID=UPI0036043772
MAATGSACSAGRGSLQASSDSDSDSDAEPPRVSGRGASGPGSQVIHSGHFMVSSPHSDRRRSGFFDTVNRTWCQTYRFGPLRSGSLSIDPTLTRLFDCMSLAYSGKMVSPKWKSFKGLRLLWRDKIRLNNAIWRAWFIQYVERRKITACGFVTPLEGSEADSHRKPEAIVLEGSYWKRRIEVVIKEYHKWRIYYKKRLQKKEDDILSMLQEGHICQAKLERWSSQRYPEPEAAPVEAHMFDLDCLLSDISDTLFTMTQKPHPWAGDRRHTYTNNADMIQPGLTPLQPILEDFMDIPDIFMNYWVQPNEQTRFPGCGYFESPSNTEFDPVPSPVVSTCQLLINSQLTQPSLSSDNLSPSSSSNNRPDGTRLEPGCSDYQASGGVSVAVPYEHQSNLDPPVSIAYGTGIEPPAFSNVPFLYPLPCNKFGYCTTVGVTPTVTTHTASTRGVQGSEQQAHSYPQASGHPLNYPAAVSDQVQTVLPSVPGPHCFSVPEQVAATEARGKYKQKTGGLRTAGPRVAQPDPPFVHVPAPTSCLAKLLSSGTSERKPSSGLDNTLVTTKGQRSSPPSSSQSSSSKGAGWPAAIPVLTTLGHNGPHASTSRGSAVSALLTHGSTQASSALLIPKTENQSPVQLRGTDVSSLAVRFPRYPGQTSPPNPLDKSSNPESSHSGHGKTESSKEKESRRVTHISAEQKRRFNIKLGFDTLHNLVTTLSSQPSIKVNKR